MMREPIVPHLQFAMKFLSSQNLQRQRNQEISRQITSSPGYGMINPAPGIMQGASENTGMSYVTHHMGPASSGTGMVSKNANTGTSLPCGVSFCVPVLVSFWIVDRVT
jgi:E1A/CREB-binding protein